MDPGKSSTRKVPRPLQRTMFLILRPAHPLANCPRRAMIPITTLHLLALGTQERNGIPWNDEYVDDKPNPGQGSVAVCAAKRQGPQAFGESYADNFEVTCFTVGNVNSDWSSLSAVCCVMRAQTTNEMHNFDVWPMLSAPGAMICDCVQSMSRRLPKIILPSHR